MNDDPKNILQIRLAKGEISGEEYENLLSKINTTSTMENPNIREKPKNNDSPNLEDLRVEINLFIISGLATASIVGIVVGLIAPDSIGDFGRGAVSGFKKDNPTAGHTEIILYAIFSIFVFATVTSTFLKWCYEFIYKILRENIIMKKVGYLGEEETIFEKNLAKITYINSNRVQKVEFNFSWFLFAVILWVFYGICS